MPCTLDSDLVGFLEPVQQEEEEEEEEEVYLWRNSNRTDVEALSWLSVPSGSLS